MSNVPNEAPAPSRSHKLSRAGPRAPLKAVSNDERAPQNADIVIAVMGVTGAGKSTFIASVTGRKDIQIGHNLYSGKFFHESMNAWS
jgi:ABC-type hemin transport system ATPase subunit